MTPILGRTSVVGEDVPGGPNVAMLSYEAWLSRHGARPDIIGSNMLFGETPFEVIGLLPPHFTLERGKPGAPYWMPAGMNPGDIGMHNRSFRAIAKLKPGVTTEQAPTRRKQYSTAADPKKDSQREW